MSESFYDYRNNKHKVSGVGGVHQQKKFAAYGKRRKRIFMPFIHFMVEVGIFWLFLSLFTATLNIKEWGLIATILLAGLSLVSLFKMFVVYGRQKNYPTPSEANKKER